MKIMAKKNMQSSIACELPFNEAVFKSAIEATAMVMASKIQAGRKRSPNAKSTAPMLSENAAIKPQKTGAK